MTEKQETEQNTKKEVATRPPVRPVKDVVPLYDTDKFNHMQRVATLMASMSLIPSGLKAGDPQTTAANCFLIVNQAVKWEMDPFAVAQMVSVIHGRLCYEGKLIHAVIEKELNIRLKYEYTGEKGQETRGVIVHGQFENEKEARTIEGTVADWKTISKNKDGVNVSPWQPKAYDRQLAYRGAREWARRHAPGVLLGVYERDEMIEAIDAEYEVINDDEPPEAPKDVPISKEGPEVSSQPAAEVAAEDQKKADPQATEEGGQANEGGPDPHSATEAAQVERAPGPGDMGEIPAHLRRNPEKMTAKPDAVDVDQEAEAQADIASAQAREHEDTEEDDSPPDVDEVPESAPEGAPEHPEKKAATADDILDAAEVDLRLCQTPAAVKKVEETYAKAVAKMLKPDQEAFAAMISETLQKVAQR